MGLVTSTYRCWTLQWWIIRFCVAIELDPLVLVVAKFPYFAKLYDDFPSMSKIAQPSPKLINFQWLIRSYQIYKKLK